MRPTALWAIEEKRRRRNDLSDAAEEHCNRLRRVLHKDLSPSTGFSLNISSVMETWDDSTDNTTTSCSHIGGNDWQHLLMEELHHRASMQLQEAVTYSSFILQPFASAMALLAVRFELERDELSFAQTVLDKMPLQQSLK